MWWYAFINAIVLLEIYRAFTVSNYIQLVNLVLIGIYITYLADKLGLYNH